MKKPSQQNEFLILMVIIIIVLVSITGKYGFIHVDRYVYRIFTEIVKIPHQVILQIIGAEETKAAETGITEATEPPTTVSFDIPEKNDELKGADISFKLGVNNLSQIGSFPNGCEAVSAVMLLNYYGYNISSEKFVQKYLKMVPVTQDEKGQLLGPDPSQAYAGDPTSAENGWGCFANVIVEAINDYIPEDNIIAVNLTGITLNLAVEKYIKSGHPVIIWVTQDYSEVKNIYQWRDYKSNTVYSYPKNQHCVILEGYSDKYYFIQDSLQKDLTAVTKAELEKCYLSMGCQAVILSEV